MTGYWLQSLNFVLVWTSACPVEDAVPPTAPAHPFFEEQDFLEQRLHGEGRRVGGCCPQVSPGLGHRLFSSFPRPQGPGEGASLTHTGPAMLRRVAAAPCAGEAGLGIEESPALLRRLSSPCSAGPMWSATSWRRRHRCWRTGCGRRSRCCVCPSTTARAVPCPRSCWRSSSSRARPTLVGTARGGWGAGGGGPRGAPGSLQPVLPPARALQPAPGRAGQGGPGPAHAHGRRPGRGVCAALPGHPRGPCHAR